MQRGYYLLLLVISCPLCSTFETNLSFALFQMHNLKLKAALKWFRNLGIQLQFLQSSYLKYLAYSTSTILQIASSRSLKIYRFISNGKSDSFTQTGSFRQLVLMNLFKNQFSGSFASLLHVKCSHIFSRRHFNAQIVVYYVFFFFIVVIVICNFNFSFMCPNSVLSPL